MYLNRFKKLIGCSKCLHSNLRFYRTKCVQEKLFVNILGLKPEEAKMYIKENDLMRIEPQRLSETLQFLKTRDFSQEEMLASPKLFHIGVKRTWEQIYRYLDECGLKTITITNLLQIRSIRSSTIKSLKQTLISPSTDVVDRLVSFLNPRPQDFPVDDLKDENLTLSHIHREIVCRYIKYRLEASTEDIEKLFRIHKLIHNKSLAFLCENIQFAKDIGFSNQKILRNGYVLESYPKHGQEILRTIPEFAGCDMREQMRNYPKLIGCSLQNILRIYEILKKEDISDDTISKSMNIFTLSPATVQTRLEEIKAVPETRVLMNHPQTLALIVHYNRARTRLDFLHQVKLKCASLLILGYNGDCFENHVKEGKDANKMFEVERFVARLVDGNEQVVANFKKHRYYLHVPFVEMEETYLFLREKAFLNLHIRNAVQILLYPKKKIEEVFSMLSREKVVAGRKPKVNKSRLLNIVLYFLEKDHHFTGNGIWRETNNDDLL